MVPCQVKLLQHYTRWSEEKVRPVSQGNNLVMTVGRIRLLLVLMVLSLGLWTMFAKLVVPPVIESEYRGESWWFLNRMISGQATHPVSDYFQDWDSVTIRGLLSGLGFWLIALVISSPDFSRRIVGRFLGPCGGDRWEHSSISTW